MTDRELMQMALNDLEALVAYIQGSEPDLVMQVPSIEALRAALATEQKPVAWMCKTGHGTFLRETITEEMANFTHGGKKAWEPLYTAPPQRIWQGLTDEEIKEHAALLEGEWISYEGFARAIEAKLREKNS